MNAAVSVAKAPWQRNSLQTVIDTVNKYSDSIPNPIFNDAKSALNTAVDVVRDFQGPYSETFRAAYNACDYKLDFMYAKDVAGKIKIANKKKYVNPEWFAICAEIVDLYNALMTLKDKVVKRAVRSEEEMADDYVPPMPTTEAAIKVNAILKAMTDDLTKQYAGLLLKSYTNHVESYKPQTREEYLKSRTGVDFLMQLVGDKYESFTGSWIGLKSDWKSILKNEADKNADYAQRMFLYKNVTKLAVIIEAKGDFTHRILHGSVNSCGFQGEIVFMFADGSKFTVRNKVIINVSVHGKAFNQFPTTFHNVCLPDNRPAGTPKMMVGQPSQEEMIEIFAGVKA